MITQGLNTRQTMPTHGLNPRRIPLVAARQVVLFQMGITRVHTEDAGVSRTHVEDVGVILVDTEDVET